MIKTLIVACSLISGAAITVASPAAAWTAVGPRGGVAHGHGYHGGWHQGYHGGCYGGRAVAAGVAAGAAFGVAAASTRPAYYYPAPVPVYVPPHVVYAPGY